MATFERVRLEPSQWAKTLETFPDAIVYQSPAWLAFLAETQGGEPVLAALKEGSETLGYFTGLVVRKFGLKILGSPFRGWTTPYMGFNLRPGVPRRLAVTAIPEFAFRELHCAHLEVVDARATEADISGLGFELQMNATMEIDLTQGEEALLAGMSKTCRWSIRKAEKNGVSIEETLDPQFADDYAAQLKDVFDKQGLAPHFGVECIRSLLKHLTPTGKLLLLRARDSKGRCIATGIFPALHETAFFWGGASWREHQRLYPNELLQWHAMTCWKRRGMKVYNMVGTMEFKQKFGGRQTAVPLFRKSKYAALARLRSSAPALARALHRVAWKVKSFMRGKSKGAPAEAPE